MRTGLTFFALGFVCLTLWSAPAVAASRDASFLAPSAQASSSQSDVAITIEPKSEVDVGETPINVGRRATFFFVNQTAAPVDIVSITANGDSNVRADIVGDDCSKEKKILVSSRCSVTVETTPTGSGSWTAEVLMTYTAAGRIARARVVGKTAGGVSSDKKEAGLSLSTKDVKPVDFGDVEVGTGKAARTALMVNDSNEPITILSVEVIAPENGLQKLDQGCVSDMDLKAGESCPVTLLWSPETKRNISTDLIIRHSGRLGFAVIPIRGAAKDTGGAKDAGPKNDKASSVSGGPATGAGGKSPIPLSPTASEMEKMISDKIPPMSAELLPVPTSGAFSKASEPVADETLHLIGTVGNRAVIYKPDGSTVVVATGEEIILDSGKVVKITNVVPKAAEILVDDKKKVLRLEAAAALASKAAQTRSRESGPTPVVIKKRPQKESGTSPEASIVKLPTGN